MEKIRELSKHIEEEIEDAREYAMLALRCKETEPELAKLYYSLSDEEMGHMGKLHKMVAEIISKYREEKGEPPVAMMRMYDLIHEQQISHAAEVKRLQSMFRE